MPRLAATGSVNGSQGSAIDISKRVLHFHHHSCNTKVQVAEKSLARSHYFSNVASVGHLVAHRWSEKADAT
jgi:hypothetical protein